MALRYEYIGKPKDSDEGIELMQKIAPLLAEQWEARGQPFYGYPFTLNYEAFIMLWLKNAFVFIVAFEDDVPVGILIGIKFIPMYHQCSVLQIENCYGKRGEIEIGLYQYLKSLRNVIGYDELWLATHINNKDLNLGEVIGKSEIIRYK